MAGGHRSVQNALIIERRRGTLTADIVYKAALACFYLMVFAKYVFFLPIPGAVLLLPYAAAAIAADRDELTVMALCTVPLYTSVPFVSAIGICTAVFLIKFAKEIRPKKEDLILLFILVWELFHAFTIEFSVQEFVGIIVLYVFMVIAIRAYRPTEDYARIARPVAWSTLFTCAMILLQLLAKNSFNMDKTWKSLLRLGSDYVDGETGPGAYLNPNTLGFFIVISVALLVQLALTGRAKRRAHAVTAFLLVFGFFTSSRTFLICLFATGVLTVLSVRRSAGKRAKVLLISLASAAAACLIFYLITPTTFTFFFNRVVNGSDNSRSMLFARYNEIIFTSPKFILWGSGLNGVASYQMSVIGQVPHNGLQEILFIWGFPGLAAYLAYFCAMFFRASKSRARRTRLLNWIPLIVFAIKVQIGQLITFTPVPLVILLIYISVVNGLDSRDQKDQNMRETAK